MVPSIAPMNTAAVRSLRAVKGLMGHSSIAEACAQLANITTECVSFLCLPDERHRCWLHNAGSRRPRNPPETESHIMTLLCQIWWSFRPFLVDAPMSKMVVKWSSR